MQTPYDHSKIPDRTIRFSQLSPQRQWLVREMQTLGWGWIKHQVVNDREPRSIPVPKKRPCYKMTGPRRRRIEMPSGDFILKEPVVNLIDWLDEFGNGTVMIEVSEGLPLDVTVE